MKLQTIITSMCVLLLSVGFALSASAGSVDDTDADGIPDVFDNCSTIANGPGPGTMGPPATPHACGTAQEDSNSDGVGDACDADFDDDGNVLVSDFGPFLGFFGVSAGGDLDCDGDTLVSDFGIFLGLFGTAPGATAI